MREYDQRCAIALASMMYDEYAMVALLVVMAIDMAARRKRELDEDRRLSLEYLQRMLDLR